MEIAAKPIWQDTKIQEYVQAVITDPQHILGKMLPLMNKKRDYLTTRGSYW